MSYARLLTVVTPASDKALIASTDARDELGATTAQLSDARLTRWIAEASAAIVAAVDRPLRAETVTETLRTTSYVVDSPGEHFYERVGYSPAYGPITPGISLKRYPVTSVASLVEDTFTLVQDTDFEVDAVAGIMYRLAGTIRTCWSGQLITVTYTGGWPNLSDVELDIQTAVQIVLRHRYHTQGRDPALRQISVPGVLEQQLQVGSMSTNPTQLPDDAWALVQRYRDRHI